MNIAETGKVLAKVALIDNRKPDDSMILAWYEILHDVDFADAMEAVGVHRRDSPNVYIQPGHVLQIARRVREARERKNRATRILPRRQVLPDGWGTMFRKLVAEGVPPEAARAETNQKYGIIDDSAV